MALFTEKQVAPWIAMSVHWLRRMRWSGGGIPYTKMTENGAVRYRGEDVEAFLASRVQRSTSDHAEGHQPRKKKSPK